MEMYGNACKKKKDKNERRGSCEYRRKEKVKRAQENQEEVNKPKTKKCMTETASEKRREIMSVSRGENEVSAFVSLSLSVALSLTVRLYLVYYSFCLIDWASLKPAG